MTRKPPTIAFWHRRLPHWEVEDGRYFITIHLSGAIPQQGQLRLRQLAQQFTTVDDRSAPKWLELARLVFREMEHWLDRVPRIVHLQNPQIASMVMEAIAHRQNRGDWNLFEYVVMPTHVHLFGEIGARGMKSVLQDFKRFTGHEAVKILGAGKASRFWQREWFDHWSRSDEEDERISQYIRENPEKAGLVTDFREWPYGSWNLLK